MIRGLASAFLVLLVFGMALGASLLHDFGPNLLSAEVPEPPVIEPQVEPNPGSEVEEELEEERARLAAIREELEAEKARLERLQEWLEEWEGRLAEAQRQAETQHALLVERRKALEADQARLAESVEELEAQRVDLDEEWARLQAERRVLAEQRVEAENRERLSIALAATSGVLALPSTVCLVVLARRDRQASKGKRKEKAQMVRARLRPNGRREPPTRQGTPAPIPPAPIYGGNGGNGRRKERVKQAA